MEGVMEGLGGWSLGTPFSFLTFFSFSCSPTTTFFLPRSLLFFTPFTARSSSSSHLHPSGAPSLSFLSCHLLHTLLLLMAPHLPPGLPHTFLVLLTLPCPFSSSHLPLHASLLSSHHRFCGPFPYGPSSLSLSRYRALPLLCTFFFLMVLRLPPTFLLSFLLFSSLLSLGPRSSSHLFSFLKPSSFSCTSSSSPPSPRAPSSSLWLFLSAPSPSSSRPSSSSHLPPFMVPSPTPSPPPPPL